MYTLTLAKIARDFLPNGTVDDQIANLAEKTLDSYPIFSDDYRVHLNNLIFRHYYYYEIGFETYSMFKFELNNKMNEIMPYYNKLYETTLFEFDWKNDVDYLTESEEKNNAREMFGKQFGSVDVNITNTNSDSTFTPNTVDKTTYGKTEHQTGESSGDDFETNNNEETVRNGSTVEKKYGKGLKIDEHSGTDKTTDTMGISNTKKFSETPQGTISDVKAGKYLTNVTIDEPGNGSNTTNLTHGETVKVTTSPSTETTTTTYDGISNISNNEKNNETHSKNESLKTNSGSDFIEKTGNEKTETNSDSSENKKRNTSEAGENVSGAEKTINNRVSGKQNSGKSYSQLLQEYRDVLINVDMLLIDDLGDCFMQIF